jgi:type II secretory pathway component GspD/PulD (secretin)
MRGLVPRFLILPTAAAILAGLTTLPAMAQFGGGGAAATRGGANTEREYRSHTLLGEAMIEIDPETRSLIVVTDEDTNAEIQRIIDGLDQPKPQVLIKVLFLEATYTDALDFGFEGGYSYTRGDFNEGRVESVWGLAQQIDGGFWTLSADYWDTTLRAMAETSRLHVLSRPVILARNNQEAVIIVGEEVPLITSSRILEDGQVLNTVQYSDVGIILRVTPFITSNNNVEMIVAPEISTLTERGVPISSTAESPVIAKRSAETVVVTPNGQTVVIGGLMESETTDLVRKIPLLGDIPLLGALFRRTIQEEVQRELLIFLTPYIVATPEQLDVASRRETGQTRLARDAFDPDDLGRLLDGDLDQTFGREDAPDPLLHLPAPDSNQGDSDVQ